MRQRLISAAVLVPVVAIVFIAGQPWLSIAIALLSALAAYETAQLVRRAGLPANPWLAVVAPPIAVLAFEAAIGPGRVDWGWLLIAPAVALWVIATAVDGLRNSDARIGFKTWAGTTIAGLYPSLLGCAAGIASVRLTVEHSIDAFGVFDVGRLWLVVLVLTVWTLDSAAYVAGRYHGRGRFMNHISPNKTWSGAIGGTIAAVAVCTLLVALLYLRNPVLGFVLGLVIAVSAQAGDLAESMLKRAAGAKDSGTLIPGHGGILDRVDSFLFAAPAAYTVLIGYSLLVPGASI